MSRIAAAALITLAACEPLGTGECAGPEYAYLDDGYTIADERGMVEAIQRFNACYGGEYVVYSRRTLPSVGGGATFEPGFAEHYWRWLHEDGLLECITPDKQEQCE